MNDKTLCIYHGSCYDGFGAAWVANRYFAGDVDFVAAAYGVPPPDVTGRRVLMVDFCYPYAIMEKLLAQAGMLTVLDHHRSNQQALDALCDGLRAKNAIVVFDTSRSGAGIAWDVLFEGRARPPLLDRIEDRDLWRFAYDDSRMIHAALESYPMNFTWWDDLMERPLAELNAEGERLEALHWNHIRMLLPITKREMRIEGLLTPVANLPITLCSDAGVELAKENAHGFAATYMDTPIGRQFSLRSTEDGPDVSKIAARYGKLFGTSGGGHPHAAGFIAPRNWEGDETLDVARANYERAVQTSLK
jgi:hypothetical protein